MECLLLATALFVALVDQLFCAQDEVRLFNHLLADYTRSVRPSMVATKPLNVTFGLALTQIIDVDERNQILTTNCWLTQSWRDPSLNWNISHYANISVIRIPQEMLWKPDILLYNNADSEYSKSILSTNMIVTSEGDVTWLSSAIFKSSCSINVEYFPFDEQTCTMKFASWTYDGLQVDLQNQTGEADLSNYVTNGEWDLMHLIVERNVVFYSCCVAPYPDITYRIILRRRPLFYVFNLILPCVLITGIALMSFYMPSDSGEKVTLGITTLLSMTVFLMVIGESMPPTSEKLPLIGLYYGVTISLVSFATGLSVVTLNIHHRGMRGREVPSLLKHVVFDVIARLVRIRLDPPQHQLQLPDDMDTPPTRVQYVQEDVLFTSRLPDRIHGECHCHNIRATGSNGEPEFYGGGRLRPPCGHQEVPPSHPSLDLFERQFVHVLNKVYQTIERNELRLAEQDRRDVIRTEWQQMALIIDRFLLWIFTLSTMGATFGILYMSPYTKLFSI